MALVSRPTRLQAVLLWLLTVVAVLVVSVLFSFAVLVLHGAPAGGADAGAVLRRAFAQTPALLIAAIAIPQVVVAVVLGTWMLALRQAPTRVLPLPGVPMRAYGAALLITLGAMPLANVVGELAYRVFRPEQQAAEIIRAAVVSAGDGTFLMLLLAISVLPGLIEESLFRGYITTAFERGPRVAAVLIPSVLFGLFHLEPSQSAGTIVLGIAFALPRLSSGSLGPSMVAHALHNAAVLLIMRITREEITHEIEWWPVPVGLVLSGAGVLLLRGTERARAQ